MKKVCLLAVFFFLLVGSTVSEAGFVDGQISQEPVNGGEKITIIITPSDGNIYEIHEFNIGWESTDLITGEVNNGTAKITPPRGFTVQWSSMRGKSKKVRYTIPNMKENKSYKYSLLSIKYSQKTFW